MATKRKPARRRFTMLVTVSVPYSTSAASARKEVKTLITHQSNWRLDPDDVKALSVNPVKRFPARWAGDSTAFNGPRK